MPLFAVFSARIILNERQSLQAYISLIPIVLGVVVASVTEFAFNFLGFFSALCSTAGNLCFLNAFVKKALHETGLHHVQLLGLIAQGAAILCVPIWLCHDVRLWIGILAADKSLNEAEKSDNAHIRSTVRVPVMEGSFLPLFSTVVSALNSS